MSLGFLTIIHLFGVIIGAGGAFTSDLMFFSSIRDQKLTKEELRFMKLGSTMVWLGLTILVISGSALFSRDPARYLASSKFLLKLTIVAVIITNGIIFHRWHIPRFHRHAEHHLPSSDEFMRTRPWLLASGAVSVVSWVSAIVLGAVPSIPVSYSVGLLGYIVLLAWAVTTAWVIKAFVLPHHRQR